MIHATVLLSLISHAWHALGPTRSGGAPVAQESAANKSEWEWLTDPHIWGSNEDALCGPYPATPPKAPKAIVANRWLYRRATEAGRASDLLAPWILDPATRAPKAAADDRSAPATGQWLASAGPVLGESQCAYAEIESSATEVRMARLSGAAWMLVNGEMFVGDPLRRGFQGVPVELRAGTNRIFVASDGARFELELWTPLSPLVIEAFDVQWPPMGSPRDDMDFDVQFPIFNATMNTIQEVHVHYGDAVWWNGSGGPSVEDWTDCGYLVPLGMHLGGAYSYFLLGEPGRDVTAVDRNICVPITVFTATGFADRKLLRRQAAPDAAKPNNFETIPRPPHALDGSITGLWEGVSVHVLGTKDTDALHRAELARARFLQGMTWYRSGSVPTTLTDELFLTGIDEHDSSHWISRRATSMPVVLYGNADTNAAWSMFVGKDSPIDVRAGHVRIDGVEFTGSDLAGWYTFVHEGKQVTLLFDTGEKGARLGSALAVGWNGKPESTALFRVSATAACGWESIPLPAPK